MKKIVVSTGLLLFFMPVMVWAQLTFPVDTLSGQIAFSKTEPVEISKDERYNRIRAWFLNYYKISRFEDHLKIAKKGKPIQLLEDKVQRTISGKGGFYIMYPNDRSGLNMERIFIMLTVLVAITDEGYKTVMTDIVCKGSLSQHDMRPPEYPLESYNERRLNDKDYVQDYVIPQVNNSIRKLQEEISQAIKKGQLKEER